MTEAFIAERLDRHGDRVREHSAQHVNRRIARDIEISVQHHTREGRDSVQRRLAELDSEWDIDRVLMANLAVVGGATYGIGLARYAHGSWWSGRRTGLLYVVGVQLGFLLMHASIGWCPPAAVFRRLGVRTKSEIELERSMLEAAIEPPLTAGEKPSVFAENSAPKSVPQAVS
jgi:hypothetical protein